MIYRNRDGIEVSESERGCAYRVDAPVRGNGMDMLCEVRFQSGPAESIGVNGLSADVVIAIVIDHVKKNGRGVNSSRAIVAMENALQWIVACR